MSLKLYWNVCDALQPLAKLFRPHEHEEFEFTRIEWANGVLIARGAVGRMHFQADLNFYGARSVLPACSICGSGRYCPHVIATAALVHESGIADEIEYSDGTPLVFSVERKSKREQRDSLWKSQLGMLAGHLRGFSAETPSRPKFPPNREAIYVLAPDRYSGFSDALDIGVATRPLNAAELLAGSGAFRSKKITKTIYRKFTAGASALAASADPLDREIAEKISLVSSSFSYYESREHMQFKVSPGTNAPLVARLAQSGRLFYNSEYALHDGIEPLGWLSDDRFDLKFEIAGKNSRDLSVDFCAVAPPLVVSLHGLKRISSWFFIDAQDRLGLFRRAIPQQLLGAVESGNPILVPRKQSADLIERVMGLQPGLGVQFTDCDDIRPQHVVVVPKPRIHIKAPPKASDTLEGDVHFDYDGVLIPLTRRAAQFYDRQRAVVVQIDTEFHEKSEQLLTSIGAKLLRRSEGAHLTLSKKKLPGIVGQLIGHGWHVEADGKLYRTGSKYDISVVSGIDWFELQGNAHFDGAIIDLPRLLQSLRAGESSVVLDDGSIGLIPEAWMKRFGGLAELGTSEDGAIKFGRGQVGLLDALLAEQGEINVDEKFAAAREGLRGFDRIEAQEPPAGFVGTLRPYQKLAQGWFEFLRNLGFGGCLADDMGLGKTIQVLSLLEHRRQLNSGPSLIVVPRSLIFNWTAEARKFAPNLRVLDQSHSQRQKGTEHLSGFDLVLTTYGTLRRDAAFLKDFEFDYVILDEAQAIKNAATEAAKAARLLKGRHKLALSGTPIENHLGELWSLFDFLNPGMLGRVGRFATLAQNADTDQRTLLAAAVRPFILRRTKRQVAPELPDRVEQTIIVELDPEQRRAYDELREYYRQALLKKIDTDGIGKSQIVILEALLRLRQAACHPGLIDKARIAEPSAKLEELLARLSSAVEAGERVLVFSQFTSFLAIVKHRLKQAKTEFLYLDGQTRNRQALVEQFQSGTGPSVFLISLKAGGVGLNLTAARNVYLLDPWWNPAVEAQAIDRSHRIGQQQTVFATRLIAADTVEQKVLDLQSKKKDLADAIVNADNAGISSLTREDIELLLA